MDRQEIQQLCMRCSKLQTKAAEIERTAKELLDVNPLLAAGKIKQLVKDSSELSRHQAAELDNLASVVMVMNAEMQTLRDQLKGYLPGANNGA